METPVWVIDTNILVSAALTAGGKCDQVLRAAMDGKIRLAWSTPILAEYGAVLSRPKFKFSPFAVSSLLAIFGPADQVEMKTAPVLPDRDDEIFLGTALSTPDKILVTGNEAHYPEEICTPVRILTPAQAVLHLNEI